MSFSLSLGVGLTRRGGGGGGGAASYFWDDYAVARLHDADVSASLGDAVGAAVTSWADIGPNGLAAYAQTSGTGVKVFSSGGVKHVKGDNVSGYLAAASNTNLRGADMWMLIRSPSGTDFFGSNDIGMQIRYYGGPQYVGVVFGATRYGQSDILSGSSPAITPSTWYAVRLTLTETDGAQFWFNGVLRGSRTGDFSASPSAAQNLPYLLTSDPAGGVTYSNAAIALIAVLPEWEVAIDGVSKAGTPSKDEAPIWAYLEAKRALMHAAENP
jgi:hypothetical protein